MINLFAPLMAYRYFRAKREEKFISFISTISMLGMAIGVAALIIVMSVMNGFHLELTKNIVGLNGNIIITGYGPLVPEPKKVTTFLQEKPEVTQFYQVINGQAFAIGKRQNSGVMVKAMTLQELAKKRPITGNILRGSLKDFNQSNAIVIGAELANSLGLTVGEQLQLISSSTLGSAFGQVPRSKKFTIIAIFGSGMFDYDSLTILMNKTIGSKFLGFKNFNLIEVDIVQMTQASQLARQWQEELGEQYRLRSWQENNKQLLQALSVERSAMFVILSLITLVAGFNIVSGLFMIVKEKRADIAVLKTMGASNKQIIAIFMLNGLFSGLIGISIGCGLGLAFTANINIIKGWMEQLLGHRLFDPAIYFLYNLPCHLDYQDLGIIISMALLLSTLASIYPALRASRILPSEVMRYE